MYNNDGKHWSEYERKLWTICLFVLTAVLFAARVAMSVCATSISKEFNWNKADLGAAMGSFFWGYLTTQVLGGWIADKVGGDKVLCVSVIIWGLLTIMTPFIARCQVNFVSALALLTIVRVLLGVSQGVHYPSMMSLLGRKIPETERSFPSGIILSAANFGTLACGGIGSVILENHKWDDVFYVIGVTAIICTYFLISLLHKTRTKVIAMDNIIQPSTHNTAENIPWKRIFSKRQVWSIIFAHVCMNNCFYIFLSWLPTYFHDNYPNEKGWVYNTVPWLLSVPTCVLSGWISEKLINSNWSIGHTRKIMEVIALLGSGLFGFLLPFCPNFSSAVICSAAAVSFQTFHNSGVLVNPQDIAPTCAGSVFGLMNAFGALQGFLGVYVTGCILNTWHNWVIVFSIMGIVNLFGLAAFLFAGTGNRIL
ncbi:unnamed protein product [Clavelina lepadiformis]|uniref:Major facilitator superfamily (MFS) profile domain-containing protein n=1 Tax=Clavelina lepadiformis TaxID=159417 RepID=A0ABP0F5G9_CLALP